MAKTPLLDIMVPTHGKLDLTIPCVESIYRNTKAPFHLIVVDDSEASKAQPSYIPIPEAAKPLEPWDATRVYMEAFVKFHDNVSYYQSNNPFISGNQFFNVAIKLMKTPYLATVMNSIRVENSWDVKGLELMQSDPKIGVVGFKCLFPDGTIECAGIHLHDGFMPVDIGRDMQGTLLTDNYEVEAIQWAFALLRKEAVAGNLDETIFHGFKGWDDIDNCFVLKKKGWKIWYCGWGIGTHHPRATRGDNSLDGYFKNKENARSFYKRWGLWNKYREAEKMDVSERISEEMKTNLKAVLTELQMMATLLESRKSTLQYLHNKCLTDELGVDPKRYMLGMNPATNQYDLKERPETIDKPVVPAKLEVVAKPNETAGRPAIVAPKAEKEVRPDNGKGDMAKELIAKAMQERNEAVAKLEKEYQGKLDEAHSLTIEVK